MQNVAKNKFGILLVATALIACYLMFAGARTVSAKPSNVITQSSGAATTTTAFMTPGTGTTTYQFDSPTYVAGVAGKVSNMSSIDAASLYILFNASTSASALAWQIQFSNNNVDWYGESSTGGGTSAASSTSLTGSTLIQESTSTVTHLWGPNVSGISMKVINLPAISALHERIVFSVPNGTANGTLYNEVDLKTNPTNP